MNRLLMILTPPAVVLAGLLLIGGDPAAAGPESHAPAPPADLAPVAAPVPVAVAPAARSEPVPAPEAAPDLPTAAPDPVARADELLALVHDWVASGVEGSPEGVVRDLTDLMERHPETAAYLLAAMESADRRTWTVVGHAFARLNDPSRQVELVRAHRKLDPWNRRLEAATADPESLLAALRDRTDPDFRVRLLDGVPDGLLRNSDVRNRLIEIANRDESDAARGRAILRLSRDHVPESTALLLRIVEDGTRAASDRQSAAMGLARNRAPEVGELWRRVLERRDSMPILLHAVRGIGAHLAEPGAADALLAEVSAGSNPEKLRSAAVMAMARGLGQLDESAKNAILDRMLGLATELERTGEAPQLLAQIRSRFGRQFKQGSGAEAQAILRSE